MNKIILSLFLLLSSLTVTEGQAIKVGDKFKKLKCQTHNSKKCATLEGFKAELKAQCASESGNCRYVFCNQNCTKSNQVDASFCKEHCFSPKLLARFNADKRELFYKSSIFSGYQDKSPADKYEATMEALQLEGKVRKLKSGRALGYSKKQADQDLYNALNDYRTAAMKNIQEDQRHANARKNWKKIGNEAVAFLKKEERFKKKTDRSLYKKLLSEKQIMLQHLSPTYPPEEVRAVIEDALKQGVKPEEIVLAFDFDGTLSTRDLERKGATVLRGGQDFLEFLNWAKDSGMHLVVDTAAGAGALETLSTQASKQLGIGNIFSVNPDHGIGRKFLISSLNEGGVITVNGEEEKVAISNNFVTGERSGYNKPHYLNAYIDKKGIKPKLVIFLDDGAVNVVNMMKSFPELMPIVPLLAVHVPQLEKMPGFYGLLGNASQFKKAMDNELKNPQLNGLASKDKIIMAGNNLAAKEFSREKQPEPDEAGNAAFIAYSNLSEK